ncbi:MAG: hypothetical protein E7055_09085 [Lentisphaerae bacterium]|nr:hypothetical protein [Lentisphaerota bacterium]
MVENSRIESRVRGFAGKLFIAAVCSGSLLLSGAEVFHFNFRDADGKSELKSGETVLKSKRVPLLVQKNSLRLAPVPEIEITGKIPDLTRQFSVSAWVFNTRGPSVNPILSRGKRGNSQIMFTTGPGLYTQVKHQITGINLSGRLPATHLWHQLTATYNQGEYKIYVDGKLQTTGKGMKQLPASNEPLLVGVEANSVPRAKLPFFHSDMLVNDLHLWDHALSADEIAKVYEAERGSYPKGNQIPADVYPWQANPPCLHYLPEGFDTAFQKELALTRTYRPDPKETAVEVKSSRIVGNPGAAPKLLINDREYMPYMSMGGFTNYGKLDYRAASMHVRDFAAAGIKLRRVSVHMGNHPTLKDNIWLGYGKYDFKILDDYLKSVLKGDPAAKLDIYISLHYTPVWFRQQHPDEVEELMLPNGKKVKEYSGQLGSDVYKKYGERWVADVIEHIEKSPYAGKVFSYTITGGMSREWYWPGTFRGIMPGYSKPTLNLFRKWLKKRYPNAADMQKAWGRPDVTPETAEVPLPPDRRFSETLLLRDPEKSVPVVDFRRFLNDRTFECLSDLAKVAKKACGGKKLVGTYSGYSFSNELKEHVGGTSIFGRVVRLPEIDFTQLALVYNYGRLLGSAGMCVNPYNGSSMLHSKLLWHESDIRTSAALAATGNEWYRRHLSDQETATVIERNLAYAVTKGDGLYECPMYGFSAYHNNTIQQGLKRAATIAENVKHLPRRTAAEIAVICDEDSALYQPWPNPKNLYFYNQLFYYFNCDAPKAGVPLDFYTMADLKESAMHDYKMYIFLNAWEVSPAMREAIRKKLARNDATAVWCYAPGYIRNGKFDLAGMKELTGIGFQTARSDKTATLVPQNGSPIFKYSPPARKFNCDPVFIPEGKDLTVHATNAGKPAMVESRNGKQRTIYTLLPLDQRLLRGLAEYCGIHIWLDTEDAFGANDSLIMIHAASAGDKKIRLPRKAMVRDARTGKVIRENSDKFTVHLDKFENGVYILE